MLHYFKLGLINELLLILFLIDLIIFALFVSEMDLKIYQITKKIILWINKLKKRPK